MKIKKNTFTSKYGYDINNNINTTKYSQSVKSNKIPYKDIAKQANKTTTQINTIQNGNIWYEKFGVEE